MKALGKATGVVALGGRVGGPDLPSCNTALCSAAFRVKAEHTGGGGAVQTEITVC